MNLPKFPKRVQERKEIARKLLVVILAMGDRANEVVDGGTMVYWIKKAVHEICPEILWAQYDWLSSDDSEVLEKK